MGYIDIIKDEIYDLYCEEINKQDNLSDEEKREKLVYFLNKLNLI